MRLFLFISFIAAGCSKSPSTVQPEPVKLNRKFFDDKASPGKSRPMPKIEKKSPP